MYKIIKSVIESRDYKLEDILYKIDKIYVESRITETEKSELDNMARSNARVENSYDIQRQLDSIFARLEALENKNTETEDEVRPTEEYSEFVQPTGAHDSYQTGDKVTYNGKKYTCIMDNCVWSPDTYPQGWDKISETTNEEVAEGE